MIEIDLQRPAFDFAQLPIGTRFAWPVFGSLVWVRKTNVGTAHVRGAMSITMYPDDTIRLPSPFFVMIAEAFIWRLISNQSEYNKT